MREQPFEVAALLSAPGTLRDASSRATKAFYPALSMCDLIFSGVFERHHRLTLAIVEFELSWGAECAHLHGLHLPRAPRRGDLPVQERHAPERFFPNVVLSFQEDAIGIRLRDVIGGARTIRTAS